MTREQVRLFVRRQVRKLIYGPDAKLAKEDWERVEAVAGSVVATWMQDRQCVADEYAVRLGYEMALANGKLVRLRDLLDEIMGDEGRDLDVVERVRLLVGMSEIGQEGR